MRTISHLNTVIRRMEDELIKSKDPYEIEKIQRALKERRIELRNMEIREMNHWKVLV